MDGGNRASSCLTRRELSLELVDEVRIGFAVVRLGVHRLHDQADELRLIANGNWISMSLSARASTFWEVSQ